MTVGTPLLLSCVSIQNAVVIGSIGTTLGNTLYFGIPSLATQPGPSIADRCYLLG